MDGAVVPEGDAVHRAAVRLRVLVGEPVAAESPHPRGEATGVARAVDGRVLQRVDAAGKHLLLRFAGPVTVRSHLRMSGRWRVRPVGVPLVGRPWLVLRGERWEATQWNGPVLALGEGRVALLGPDVLADATTVDGLLASVRTQPPARALGDALLDQSVVAGVGTVWLAELLWRAGVAPTLPLREATDDELRRGLAWAREEMRASVAGARPARAVYRRPGRPCPRCGEPIRSGRIGDANRVTYWCARCQRG